MNGTDQEITNTADDDNGRNSPHNQYWHGTLLCFCPQLENADVLSVVPDRLGDWLDPALGITRMADYRAYVVGGDGHFTSFEGFALPRRPRSHRQGAAAC
jgi:hypothetical protein